MDVTSRARAADPKVLDVKYAEMFSSMRLDTLLAITTGISMPGLVEKQRTVNEVEWRHEWDAMLYRFYVTPDEIVSTQVL